VHGLELTADDIGGRRNRIDTVLVRRVRPAAEAADDAERSEVGS
jgi:hypothetical protein